MWTISPDIASRKIERAIPEERLLRSKGSLCYFFDVKSREKIFQICSIAGPKMEGKIACQQKLEWLSVLARWVHHVTINYDVSGKLFAGGRSRIQKGGFRSVASRTDPWRKAEFTKNLAPCMETQGHPTIQSLQNPLTNLIERYGPVIIGFLGLWIVIFVREWLCVAPPKWRWHRKMALKWRGLFSHSHRPSDLSLTSANHL